MKIKFDMKDIISVDTKNGAILIRSEGIDMFMRAASVPTQYSANEINGRLAVIPLDYIYKQYARPGEFVVDKELGILWMKVNDGRLVPFNTELTHVVNHMFRSHYIMNTEPAAPDTDYATVWYHTGSPINIHEESHIAKTKVMQYVEDSNGNKAYRWVNIFPKTVSPAVVIEGMGNGETNYTLDDFVRDMRANNDKYDKAFNNLIKDLNDVLNSTTVSEQDEVVNTTGYDIGSVTYTKALPARSTTDVYIDGLLLNRNQYTINTSTKVITFNKVITVKASVRIKSTFVSFTGLPIVLNKTRELKEEIDKNKV